MTMIIPARIAAPLKSSTKLIIFCAAIVLASCSSSQKAPTSVAKPVNTSAQTPSELQQDDSTLTGNAYRDKSVQSSPLFDNADPYKNPSTQLPSDILSDPTKSPLNQTEELVKNGAYAQAQAIAQRIDRSRLSLQEQMRLNLAEAQIFSALNQDQNALQRINTIKPTLLSNEDNARLFWLKARTLYQLGDIQGALEALADRENYIPQQDIAANQKMMFDILATLSPQEQQTLSLNTQNPNLQYWLGSNKFIQDPNIPAPLITGPTANTFSTNNISSSWQANSPRRIAILLPFSSNFANAAKQFEAGFNLAHRNNQTSKPQLRFYDVGGGDIQHKLKLAIQNGADFIVGPLGKRAAEAALNISMSVPILTIGGYNANQANKFTFSLSPEAEGAAIAQHARAKGYQNAIILTPNTPSSARLSGAFQRVWESLGGVTQSHEFSPGIFDHSPTVKLALGIYSSEQRHHELSGIIGTTPKFNARRRANIDMILLASNYQDAKNIKPQLNFFDAHKLPTYGASSLNRLSATAGEKADLDGLIIPEMPAVLNSQITDLSSSTQVNAETSQKFNRLQALGYDSYQLIPILTTLQNQRASFQGKTGKLLIDASGNTVRVPSWAKFSSGLLKPIQ